MRRCVPSTVDRSSRFFAPGLVVLLSLAGGWGCAAHRQATEQKLRAIEDQVDLLQSANGRLEERLGELELAARRAPKGASAPETAAAIGPERPPLEVLKLAPEGDAAAAGAPAGGKGPGAAPEGTAAGDDEGSRLLIQGTGDRLEAREPKPTSWVDPRALGPRAQSRASLHNGAASTVAPDRGDTTRRS